MTNKKTKPELKLEEVAEKEPKKVMVDTHSTLTPADLDLAIEFAQGKSGVKPEDQQKLEDILSTKVNVWEAMQIAKVFGTLILNQDLTLMEGLFDNFSIQRKVLLDNGIIDEDTLKKATEEFYEKKKEAMEAEEKIDKAKSDK